jgi:hypothetical protein
LREKQLRVEKIQLKNLQRHRYRAEVYAINSYLKNLEQQRYADMMKSREEGDNPQNNVAAYDSDDSSVSRASVDSNTQQDPAPITNSLRRSRALGGSGSHNLHQSSAGSSRPRDESARRMRRSLPPASCNARSKSGPAGGGGDVCSDGMKAKARQPSYGV